MTDAEPAELPAELPPAEITQEMVDALEEALDAWEVASSPLDEDALRKYALMREALHYVRTQLPRPQQD